jgi:hypothetical protein
MTDTTPKRVIDWERIEFEYRAGQLSVNEIAKRNSITEAAIRKRAKRDSWTRPLADKVRRAVREKLVRDDGSNAPRATDAEVIEAASERGSELIKTHRKDINSLRCLCADMANELKDIRDHQNDIEADIQAETLNDKDRLRRTRMMRAVSLYGRSGVLTNLSQVMAKLVPLERQAFSIDDARPEDNGLDRLMEAIDGTGWQPQAGD